MEVSNKDASFVFVISLCISRDRFYENKCSYVPLVKSEVGPLGAEPVWVLLDLSRDFLTDLLNCMTTIYAAVNLDLSLFFFNFMFSQLLIFFYTIAVVKHGSFTCRTILTTK